MERSERERERRVHRGSQKEDISPKPVTGKMRGLIFVSFYKHRAQTLEF